MPFFKYSSIVKWWGEGDQLKTTKWDIWAFMALELKGIKQRFKVLNICLAYWGSAKCLF